jgi:transcription initiation factor TFIIIB Brf1 subunit/transcription initiation factor TFIIB
MERACRSLELPGSVLARARELYAQSLKATNIRRPRLGLAAACVYVAAKLEGSQWTQLEVAREVGVAEPTLRTNIEAVAPHVRCEREVGERQDRRAFCSALDNWCSRQGEIWRCPLRKRGGEAK